MASFIEITTDSGNVTLAISSITFVEPGPAPGNKAVIHVLPEINGSIPFTTATETYATFIARLP